MSLTHPDSAPPVLVPVDARRLSWIRKLAADYVFQHSSLAAFFAGDPSSRASWIEAIDRTQAHPRPGTDLAAIITAQQRLRGAPAEALAATSLLADRRTVAVVTGQQAGLFGGPIFTLLKGLTAVALARRTSREFGVPAVGVFWIDAEDHDWDEVAGCSVLGADLERATVALPAPPGAGTVPVAAITLDESISRALDELADALPRTEFTAGMLERLRLAYRPGVGFTQAFGRWIEAVMGPLGLIVFDAADAAAKPLAAGVFAREIEEPNRTSELAAEAGARLAALGYHQQVAEKRGPALFRLNGRRTPIRQHGASFEVGNDTVAAAALRAAALSNPEGFSPNVLLRPLVQDTLFPTVAYVPGPNELGYHAQLRSVYQHFGLPMPLLHPRVSATVLDAAASRFLQRHELPLDALEPGSDAVLNQLVAAALPPSVERSLDAARQSVEQTMSALGAALPAVDPTLEGAARASLGRMRHEIDSLTARIVGAAKRRDDTLRRQFARVQAQVFPGGEPQERSLGFVSLLNRCGPGLIDRLADERLLELGRHWIVTL